MDDEIIDIGQLIKRQRRKGLSMPEQAILDRWINRSDANRQVMEKATDEELEMECLMLVTELDEATLDKKVSVRVGWEVVPMAGRSVPFHKIWYAAAGVLLTLLFVPWGKQTSSGSKDAMIGMPLTIDLAALASKVAPDQYGSMLILPDSSHVVLDGLPDSARLRLPDDDLTTIEKAGSSLHYTGDGVASGVSLYNILRTGKVNPWSIRLEDGTRVVLADHSSFKYPVAFDGRHREVELTGKAYFEVAPHKSIPFIIRANKLRVTATGTSFEVSSYKDDPSGRIALFSGTVKVQTEKDSLDLAPGDLATVSGEKISVGAIQDSASLMAWNTTDTLFSFDHTPMEDAIRDIARWHGLKPCFLNSMHSDPITGFLSRRQSLYESIRQLTAGQQHKRYFLCITTAHDSLLITSVMRRE
jgi:transmembrane sensor